MFYVQKIELVNSFENYLIGIINLLTLHTANELLFSQLVRRINWGFSNLHKEILVRNKKCSTFIPYL